MTQGISKVKPRWIWQLSVAVLLASPAMLGAQEGPGRPASHVVSPEMLLARISVLAHDSMAGRDTPSRELEQAATWIAGELERFGLSAPEAGMIQRYPLQRGRLDPRLGRIEFAGRSLSFGDDVVWVAGNQNASAAGGDVLLIPSTVPAAEIQETPMTGLTAVALVRSTPDGRLVPEAQQRLNVIVQQRPALVVLVAELADSVWQRMAAQQSRSILYAHWQAAEIPPVLLMRTHTMSAAMAESTGGQELGVGAGITVLPGTRLTATISNEVDEVVSAPNVVALLAGADPSLSEEYLIFTAHFDHIGIARPGGDCAPRGDDVICNGADDNASGTALIMSIAEALAEFEPRPRRSVLFLFTSGEERGLMGSDYFAAHPPMPLSNVVAAINVDNIGRMSNDTVYAVGKEHSDLGEVLDRVSAARPDLRLSPVRSPWPHEAVYARSDHYSFARRGIPILFFTSGVHEDYHQASDHVERLDTESAARVGSLLFHLGLEIANAPHRPRWDPLSHARIVEGPKP